MRDAGWLGLQLNQSTITAVNTSFVINININPLPIIYSFTNFPPRFFILFLKSLNE